MRGPGVGIGGVEKEGEVENLQQAPTDHAVRLLIVTNMSKQKLQHIRIKEGGGKTGRRVRNSIPQTEDGGRTWT